MARKIVARKTAAKKAATKKATTKKAATEKTVAKKTVARKPTAKKTPAKTAKAPATSGKLKPLAARRKQAVEIIAILRREFPDTKCSLDHQDAWQLLVATILSAQCTDARVNMVTPELFAQFPDPAAFAAAPIEDIEEAIRSTGFYRNKAKSIQGAARALLERHGGEVPNDMDAMVKVPGCGRKTANVVLGEVFNNPDGVVVDTHVGRISQKLGLTDQTDPVKIEQQLNECIPREDWRDYGHLIIDHGRKTCKARAPQCDACPIYRLCETRA